MAARVQVVQHLFPALVSAVKVSLVALHQRALVLVLVVVVVALPQLAVMV